MADASALRCVYTRYGTLRGAWFTFASARALVLLDDGLIAAIAMMPNREVESVWWRVFEQLVAEHRRCPRSCGVVGPYSGVMGLRLLRASSVYSTIILRDALVIWALYSVVLFLGMYQRDLVTRFRLPFRVACAVPNMAWICDDCLLPCRPSTAQSHDVEA